MGCRWVLVALAGGALALGSASAQADVELPGDAAVQIDGPAAGANAGHGVAGGGDINGDGSRDIVIGARGPSGGPGSAHVIFGPVEAAGIDLASPPAGNGFTITGDGGNFGATVAIAGDLNGDGFDDVVVGAPSYDASEIAPHAGRAYVIYGSAAPENVAVASLDESDGYVIRGDDHTQRAGERIAGAGDFNDDGFDDVVISVRGSHSSVIYGAATSDEVVVDNPGSRGVRFSGLAVGDNAAVAGAGDVNNDGIDDVIFGYADSAGPDLAAVAYGADEADLPDTDLKTMPPASGFRITGASAGDDTGTSVAGIGDFNADGVDDVALGAPGADPGANAGAGSVVVLYGEAEHPHVDLSQPLGDQGARLNGAVAGDRVGQELADAGDLNRDGIADLAVGAPFSPAPEGAGTAFVVYGSEEPAFLTLEEMTPSDGFAIRGAEAHDRAGASLAAAGAALGIGTRSLLVSAWQADPHDRFVAGAAYLISGPSTLTVSPSGPGAGYVSSTPAGIDCGVGIAGHDVCAITNQPGSPAMTLVAHPEPDSTFAGFDGGGCAPFLLTCQIAVNRSQEIAATFAGEAAPGRCDGGVLGSAEADRIKGGPKADRIRGREGNDVLRGLGGNDCLNGEAGRDKLAGGAGRDRLHGEAGRDKLAGGAGRDALNGGPGADVLKGGGGRDVIRTGPGRDRVNCGGGKDKVFVQGRDRLHRNCERIVR